MRDPTIGMANAGIDPLILATLRALERQADDLHRIRSGVADALDTIPGAPPSGWRGLAAASFDLAASDLRTRLALATLRLGDAAGDTQQAISTMSGRMYG